MTTQQIQRPNRRQWLRLAAGAGGTALGILAAEANAGGVSGSLNAARSAGASILLYSGWATHNIGDIGHTPGTLRYLTQHFPGVPVDCWLYKSNPAVHEMLRRRFPTVGLVEGSLDSGGKATTPELQHAFDRAGLFIQNSGMHFTRYWRPPTGLIRACMAHQKPFGLYAQSFDGFRDEDAAVLPGLLSQAAFIFCRDTESLHFLRTVGGITPGVLEFGPDGCFGIDVRDDSRADAFLRENHLERNRFLTVTFRSDREKSKNPADQEREQAAPGPEEWAVKLRAIIVAWVRRTGNPVVLAPEVEKEIGPARRMLRDPLPDDVRAHVVHRDIFWNADEAASLYARAHTVLSVEPHSCIMALAGGTPAIHFFSRSHGYKAWMFRDIGLSEWLIDIDTEPAERVIATLARIDGSYGLARGKAARAMRFVNDRSGEMMLDIRRALGLENAV